MFTERQRPISQADSWRSRCRIGASDQGATAIEYALIAAFIAAVIFAALLQLGDSLRNLPFQLLIDAMMGASPQ